MKKFVLIAFLVTLFFVQCSQVPGQYIKKGKVNSPAGRSRYRVSLYLQPDSTYNCRSIVYFRDKVLNEDNFRGTWCLNGDTVVLVHDNLIERWLLKNGKIIKMAPNNLMLIKLRKVR